MKLATLRDGTRDGHLVVVAADLSCYADAAPVAPTLQAALDDWRAISPALQRLCRDLDTGKADRKAFSQNDCESPLPRAYQWADGSAYVNHVALVRKARGAEIPASFYHDPLMYQGGSDAFCGPRDPIVLANPDWGCDMEGEVAVITDDVAMGVSEAEAHAHIKLLMLVNDVSLRGLIPAELAKGFGFFQSKPPSAFSPVAVTPDEIGDAWRDARIHLPLRVDYNQEAFGRAEAGIDATFSLARLIAHAAKTRPLAAGSIIGSGTVSNKSEDGGPGRPVCEGGRGYSCIAELRMIEHIAHGQPKTAFMRAGDRVTIDMLDHKNASIFGSIDQVVKEI